MFRDLSEAMGFQKRTRQVENLARIKKMNLEKLSQICSPRTEWQVNPVIEIIQCRHGFKMSFREAENVTDLNIAYQQVMHKNFMRVKFEGKTSYKEFDDGQLYE